MNSMNVLDKYFETFTSPNTIYSYKSVLTRYFNLFYGAGDLEAHVEKYSHETRDHEEDVKQFFMHISSYSPTSIRQYLNVVKNFVEYLRGEEFPRRFIKDLLRRRKGSRPITEDRIPTKEELRSILSHLTLRGSTLIMTLLSSGMRIGEALKLKLNDIDLNKNPVEVSIRAEYTKTGNRRMTFLSTEAKEKIIQWLRMRNDYIFSSRKKHFTNARHDKDLRLFPYSESTARDMWNLALDKAGLGEQDPQTKYRKLRLHCLRKYFRTQLSKVDNAGEMPEALLGHVDAYIRYSLDDYRDFYQRAEYAISIFGGADLEALSETQNEMRKLRDVIGKDHIQLLTLLEKMSSLEAQVKDLSERLKGAEEVLQMAGFQIDPDTGIISIEEIK
jgi:integrase